MKSHAPVKCLALLFTLTLTLTPLSLHAAPPAQGEGIDDATIDAINLAASYVAGSYGSGGVITIAPHVDIQPSDDDTDAPIEVVLGDSIRQTSQGITLYMPENWDVTTGDESPILEAEDSEYGFSLQLEPLSDNAPGLFMVPVFDSLAPMFAESLGENTTVGESQRMMINDTLPAIRIPFYGAEDPKSGTVDGVIYVIAAGVNGYGVYANSSTETWPTLGPVVDGIVASMEIDPELITVQQAGDEPLELQDQEGVYSVQLPARWFGMATGDDDLGIVFADPDVTFVGAGGLSPESDANDPMMKTLISAIAGALDEDDSAQLIQAILQEMDMTGNDAVTVDESQTTVFPAEGGDMLGVVRVVGEAPISEGVILPVALYIAVYPDRAGAFIFMGDTEAVRDNEETILQIIESAQVLE